MCVVFRPEDVGAHLIDILRHLPESSGIKFRVISYMLSRLNISRH